jgi:hypothetical protein
MRHTLTAIMVTSVVSGVLLLAATLTLERWYWQRYSGAQALHSSLSDSDAVIVENPYQIDESPIIYVPMFIAVCAAATFWVVLLLFLVCWLRAGYSLGLVQAIQLRLLLCASSRASPSPSCKGSGTTYRR